MVTPSPGSATNMNRTESNQSLGYRRLREDGFQDAQFRAKPPKVPVKSIILAAFLFCVGTTLLIIGSLLFTGYFDVQYHDRTWPVLVLGAITFIPGFYHVRIAFYAYKGYKGFSFDDIPSIDD